MRCVVGSNHRNVEGEILLKKAASLCAAHGRGHPLDVADRHGCAVWTYLLLYSHSDYFFLFFNNFVITLERHVFFPFLR